MVKMDQRKVSMHRITQFYAYPDVQVLGKAAHFRENLNTELARRRHNKRNRSLTLFNRPLVHNICTA